MRTSLVVPTLLLMLASAGCHAADEPVGATAALAGPTGAAATTASATADPHGPLILFQRDGSRRTHVAWVGRDGSGEEAPLDAFGELNQTNPDWSPDGAQLVFAMTDGTTDDLFVADAGAPEADKVVDCVAPCLYLDDPAWSPDGTRIVFSRTVARGQAAVSTLETVDLATGRTRVLLGPWTDRFTAGARWSPRGHQIVFELVQKDGPALEADLLGVTLTVLRLGEHQHPLRRLTDPSLFAATADWSPDGRHLVYSALARATDEAPDLFLVPATGGAPRPLTDLAAAGGYAAEPTFSPDGATVVFSGGRTSEEEGLLLEVTLDGREPYLATGTVEVHGRHPRLH